MSTADDFDMAAPAYHGVLALLFAPLAWGVWITTDWQVCEWVMYAYLGMGAFLFASYVLLWFPGVLPLVRVVCTLVAITLAIFNALVLLDVGLILLKKSWRWLDH